MAFKSASANDPNQEGLQYHVRLKKGDIPSAVLMPGDPARVEKIAADWDSSEKMAAHRQYITMKGKVGGTELACTSTGIGSPGVAIAMEELANIGVTTMIRVGSCGGLQPHIKVGDVVITTGAVRLEGTSKEYVRPEYPAVADYRIVAALIEAAKSLKATYHVGITASTDSFYTGQGRPSFGGYFPSFQEHLIKDLQQAKVQNFEMEASCLLTLGSLFGLQTGCISVVVADRNGGVFKITDEMEKLPGKIASQAVVLLSKQGGA